MTHYHWWYSRASFSHGLQRILPTERVLDKARSSGGVRQETILGIHPKTADEQPSTVSGLQKHPWWCNTCLIFVVWGVPNTRPPGQSMPLWISPASMQLYSWIGVRQGSEVCPTSRCIIRHISRELAIRLAKKNAHVISLLEVSCLQKWLDLHVCRV